MIKGQRMISDASLFEANAGMNSLIKREDSAPNAKILKRYEQRYHDFKEGRKQRKVSKQTHISKPDLEASLVSRIKGLSKFNRLSCNNRR
jgi:hypothetical protein